MFDMIGSDRLGANAALLRNGIINLTPHDWLRLRRFRWISQKETMGSE